MLVVRKTQKSVDKPLPLRDKQQNSFVPQKGQNAQQEEEDDPEEEEIVCRASYPALLCLILSFFRSLPEKLYFIYLKQQPDQCFVF